MMKQSTVMVSTFRGPQGIQGPQGPYALYCILK